MLTLVGPSTGHWYAHDGWNAGMGLRLGGLGGMLLGLSMIDLLSVGGGDDDQEDTGAALFVSGLALYGVGTIYEIVTAPGAAHDFNADQARLVGPHVTVTVVGPDHAPGLELSSRF